MAEHKERGLKQLPDGRWQWSFKDRCGRYHRYVARTKGEARQYLEKARTAVREGRFMDRRREIKATFEDACKRFLKWGKTNLSDSTRSMDETFVKRWKSSPHFKDKALDNYVKSAQAEGRNISKAEAVDELSKEFKRILCENDLPDIRFHDLRHTSISLLLDIGTPVNTVQHRAGHSKASVTTDIYGHVMDHSQDAAAENIEQIVKPLTIVSQ